MTARPATRPAQRVRTVALAVVLAATSFAVNAVPSPGPARSEERGSAPLPFGLGPTAANAAYCSTPNPTFTGRLTQTLQNSGTPPTLSGITSPNVYAWISKVDGAWTCTLYRRYSGCAWNTAATTGTFDWGTIINSTSVSCNWAVGSTDYLRGGILVRTAKDRNQVATSALGYTLHAYDELGRATDATEASASSPDLATITHSIYDNLDRRTSEETGYLTGTGQKTIWTYDIGGRTTKTDDEFTCATTTYDYRNLALTVVEGQASGACSGSGLRTITNAYDLLGRQTSSTISAGQGSGDVLTSSTYDSASRVLSTSATRAGATTASVFTLNPLDESVAEVRSDASTPVSWTKTNRDPAGNPTDRCVWNTNPNSELCKAVGQTFTTVPAVHTTTAYDARNNRINLLIPALGETTYDAAHNYQVKAIYVPTGSGKEHQTLFSYDSRHRLDVITQQLCTISSGHACSSTSPTGSNDYAYDDNDSRTQVIESKDGTATTTTNYCYDGLNRLISAKVSTTCATSPTETYTYDDAGNRTKTVISGATTWFGHNAAGQLCKTGASSATDCSSPNVTYDVTGRTLTWSGWTLTYDGEGRLASACKVAGCATGDMVTMRYDGDGRRVELITRPNGQSATTVTFRYQGTSLAQELTGGTISRTYVTDEAGTIVKLCDPDCSGSNPQYLVTWNGHGDALALWRIETSGSLTLANSYTYSTWGAPTTYTHNGYGDLGFRFLYVGREGVANDNAFSLGLLYMGARHYSPALGRFLQPDPIDAEANLYGYAGNSPVTKVDPDGTCWLFGGAGRRSLFLMCGPGIRTATGQRITGFTREANNRVIDRDGVGVSPKAMLDALVRPTKVGPGRGGVTIYEGRAARVLVNRDGKIVTAWALNRSGWRAR